MSKTKSNHRMSTRQGKRTVRRNEKVMRGPVQAFDVDSQEEFPTLGTPKLSATPAPTVPVVTLPTSVPDKGRATVATPVSPLTTFPYQLPTELPAGRRHPGIFRKVKEVPVPGTDYNKVVTCDDPTDVRVAVLISTGYGAGWSSWHLEHGNAFSAVAIRKRMCLDSTIIKYLFSSAKDDGMTYEQLMTTYIGFPPDNIPYDGGFKDLEVRFIPEGSLFQIIEYDGAEGIQIFDPARWNTA